VTLKRNYLAAIFVFATPVVMWSQASVLTQHNNMARTGANLSETTLTPSNVNVSSFGKLFSRNVDGQIYAQPLYVPQVTINGTTQNAVYVATENNTVCAFDADDPAASSPLWTVHLGAAAASGPLTSGDNMYPVVGITSTPVIDQVNGWMYVVAETLESNGTYAHRLHALDITTGAEVTSLGSPALIAGTVSGTGDGGTTVTFAPKPHMNRPALLLSGGNVYVAFGSHADIPPYHGWVFAYSASNLAATPIVYNVSPNTNKGGIWQSGNGPASDGSNVFLATGDGVFDYSTGGGDLGDSILQLTPSLSLVDYFTPSNAATLFLNDTDLGSAGPVVLPPLPGTTKSLLIHGGKNGTLYLVDRGSMGGFNSTDQIVQEFPASANGMFTSPVFWTGPSNSYFYIWGDSDGMRQYTWNSAMGKLNTTPFAKTSTAAFPGGAISLSANGNTNGILWATAATTTARISNAPGMLHAYDATNVATELWNSYQNQARDDFGYYSKFNPPTVANGKVYVPTFSNTLVVYGLLGPPTPDFALSASPGSQTVTAGSGASYTVTLSASGGFTGSVAYSVTGLPTGAGGTFTPSSVSGSTNPVNSTLAITTATSTPAGTYTLTVTATGTPTHSIPITLIVNPLPIGDFSLSATPGSQAVTAGTNTNYTVTMTPSGGFNGTVTYSISGLPTGAGASFAPPTATSSTTPVNSNMLVSTASTTPVGTYTLTITGSSATTHTTSVTLVVNPALGGPQTLLQIHGDATEVSGVTTGSIVTPSTAPAGFTGTVIANGTGSVNYVPAQSGNGVYFLNCCTNTNNAYYKFTSAMVGNIFNMSQGQVSFYLKSRYSFAQRKASATSPRYAFDVRDGNNAHLFAFYVQPSGTQLLFTYIVAGAAQYYFVPAGTEDTLYGSGVVMQVALAWNGSTMSLSLNGTQVKSTTYTAATPSWTSSSNFDFGAYEYLTSGGYNVSDDIIDEFTVTGPAINQAPPSLSITSPAGGATVSGTTPLTASGTSLTGVQFQIDGNNLGAVVSGAGPTYTASWDTTTVINGTHTVGAVAVGASLNTSVSVTVNNPLIAPVISNVTANSVASTSATINWTTDQSSNSQVAYGISSNPYSSTSPLNGALVTSHAVNLSQLTPSTTYHYQVLSQNLQGALATSADFTFTTAAAVQGPQTLLLIHADGSEVSGVINGSIVTPAITPPGFAGNLVVNGTGSVNYASAQVGNGVYFLNCCANTNNAYYKFTNSLVGSIFNISQGQVSFTLRSRYSFAQRKASATQPRYAFDVRDGNNAHLFAFYVQPSGTQLMFTYIMAGAAQYYFVPAGTEDTLYGSGVSMQVALSWNGTTMSLSLNGTQVKSTAYTTATPNWTAASNFDLGAYEYSISGGYNVSDDIIDEFTVAGPAINVIPPALSITTPTGGAILSGTTPLVASGTSLTGVQFQIDGSNLGAAVSGAGPTYSTTWDTTTVTNGTHTVGAVAVGAALNTSVSVSVNNPLVPPVLSNEAATSIASSSATINWNSDQASSSQVAYGLSNNPYSSLTSLNSTLVTSHSVNLSQLTPSTIYHYQVLSQNLQGALATSPDFTFTTAAATGSQPLLLIHADASEVSGVTNGSVVTPAVAPTGFTGTVVNKGGGSVNFTPAQVGNGVYFLSCCTNNHNAYYKFAGSGVGSIFNLPSGQISFYLKSRYTFAQRLASAPDPRYAFDARDGNGTHQYLFYTRTSGTSLMFTYIVGGVAQSYFVPAGTENALFGSGVTLQVKLTWNGSSMNLFLNGTMVKSSAYTPLAANWTSASNFDLGAYEYSTSGGYNVSDDVVDEFAVAPFP